MGARKSYARLSPEEIDEVRFRLKSGQAAKVAARQLGLPSSTLRTYLVRGRGRTGSASRSVTGV